MAVLNPDSKILFYDDASDNIETVNAACKSNVTGILIPTSTRMPPINKETNVYYKYLVALNVQHNDYDAHSGIQEEQIEQLRSWAATTTGPRHVVFDWDYTLSMCSGMLLPDVPRDSSISSVYEMDLHKKYSAARIYEDILCYIMGGAKRLKMLREMFAFLKKAAVKVYILTNNPNCNLPSRAPQYRELVYALTKYRTVEIICGGIDKFNLDKGLAIKSTIPACARTCKAKKRRSRGRTKKRVAN